MNTVRLLSLFSLLALGSSCSTLEKIKGVGTPVGVREEKPLLKPAWIKNLDPVYNTGNLPIGLQSPLIYDGAVYAGHNEGHMQAYELENGRLMWSGDDGSTFHSGAVAHKDQVIYGTVQGRVISRNAVTGIIKYSVDLGASVETRGLVYNGRIFFQLRNHQVFSLDVETGKILWGYKRSVPYLTTLQRTSRPAVSEDRLIVGFADGTLAALSLEEGVLLYDTKLSNASKFVDADTEPLILDGKVYASAGNGFISQLDAKTGQILRTGDFFATRAPLLENGEMIFGTSDGEIVVTDKNLARQQTVKISKGGITNIVRYKGNYAVTTTAGEVIVIKPKSFEKVESYHLGHSYSAVFGDVSVTEDELAVISSRNRLYLFK